MSPKFLPRRSFLESTAALGVAGQELLEGVFEGAPFGVYVDHPTQGCTYANQYLLDQFALDWADFQGFGWATLVVEEDVARLQVAIQEFQHSRDTIILTYRITRPGGEIRWVHARVRAVVNASDERVGSIGLTMDVTDQRRFEERLGDAQKLEAVGHLAARLAHDLNNLMTVIMGAADSLGELAGTDAASRDLDTLDVAFEQAQQLTDQLLVLSKRRVRARTSCELDVELGRMSRLLVGTLGEGIEVDISLGANELHVPLDPSALGQIVLNLASNARDAMQGRGRLRIVTTPAEANVTITVTDEGEGMNSETLARAFEPFFTTKEEGRGTGLGLATLHDLTKVVGGTISIESEVGEGTSVHVTLPTVRPDPARASTDREEEVEAPPSVILVVEDNEAIRQSVAYALALAGHTVTTAHSLADGHSQLDEGGAIEVLVSDVMLPDGSGIDFYSTVSPDHSLPVVFMSGFVGGNADTLEYLEGPATFVPKPFHAQDIVHAVARVIASA